MRPIIVDDKSSGSINKFNLCFQYSQRIYVFNAVSTHVFDKTILVIVHGIKVKQSEAFPVRDQRR